MPETKDKATRDREMKSIRTSIYLLLTIAAVLSIFMYIKGLPPPAGTYTAFARCISQTSTTFYGAFWCPHCHNQKNEFGDAAQYLPYVECSQPDGVHEMQVCIDKGVAHYPTWFFPDGSSSTGEQSLQTLSAKTGCALPTSSPA